MLSNFDVHEKDFRKLEESVIIGLWDDFSVKIKAKSTKEDIKEKKAYMKDALDIILLENKREKALAFFLWMDDGESSPPTRVPLFGLFPWVAFEQSSSQPNWFSYIKMPKKINTTKLLGCRDETRFCFESSISIIKIVPSQCLKIAQKSLIRPKKSYSQHSVFVYYWGEILAKKKWQWDFFGDFSTTVSCTINS